MESHCLASVQNNNVPKHPKLSTDKADNVLFPICVCDPAESNVTDFQSCQKFLVNFSSNDSSSLTNIEDQQPEVLSDQCGIATEMESITDAENTAVKKQNIRHSKKSPKNKVPSSSETKKKREDALHECDLCQKSFLSKLYFKHMSSEHFPGPEHVCDVCEYYLVIFNGQPGIMYTLSL